MRHIALMGRARSGKDTVAAHLVAAHGYKRVAFADPLKEMALKADPIVYGFVDDNLPGEPIATEVHLSEEVNAAGWEQAKDEEPEVRRFLQSLGSAVRDVLGPGTWLRKGLENARQHMWAGHPVVFTDVRYQNEATALRHWGFTMVRIERPASHSDDTHASETELDNYAADVTLVNDGSVSDLRAKLEGLVR